MHEHPFLPERGIINEENPRRPILPENIIADEGNARKPLLPQQVMTREMHEDPFYQSLI